MGSGLTHDQSTIEGAWYDLQWDGKANLGFMVGQEIDLTTGGTGTVAYTWGIDMTFSPGSSGAHTEQIGFRCSLVDWFETAGSLTDFYHIKLMAPTLSGVGTITNLYGLYIENQYNAGISGNNYNFYSAGATSKNKFEGSIETTITDHRVIWSDSGTLTGSSELTFRNSGTMHGLRIDVYDTDNSSTPYALQTYANRTAGSGGYILAIDAGSYMYSDDGAIASLQDYGVSSAPYLDATIYNITGITTHGFHYAPNTIAAATGTTLSIDELAGVYVFATTPGGDGTVSIKDIYGVYIDDFTTMGASGVCYNLYSKGSTSQNLFEGDVTIGGDLDVSTGAISISGSDHQVLFNDAGVISGDAGLTFTKTSTYASGGLDLTNFMLTQTRSIADITSGNYIMYNMRLVNELDNPDPTYGAVTLYGIQNLLDLAVTNQKRSVTAYGLYTKVTDSMLIDESAYAYQWLRYTGTGNTTAGETVTINGKVYTFRATITNIEGEVKIGASMIESMSNLAAAVNGTGTYGVEHSCAAANPDAEAVSVAAAGMAFRARVAGSAGDALTFAEACLRLVKASGGFFSRNLDSGLSNGYAGYFTVETETGKVGGLTGLRGDAVHGAFEGASSAVVTGGIFNATFDCTLASQTRFWAYGVKGQVTNLAGNMDKATAVYANIQAENDSGVTGWGSFDIASLFYGETLGAMSAITIDTWYGLYLADPDPSSIHTINNRYGIYVGGSTFNSVFEGRAFFGSATLTEYALYPVAKAVFLNHAVISATSGAESNVTAVTISAKAEDTTLGLRVYSEAAANSVFATAIFADSYVYNKTGVMVYGATINGNIISDAAAAGAAMLYGLSVSATADSQATFANTITEMAAIDVHSNPRASSGASVVVTDSYGVKISIDGSGGGTETITNIYGLYVSDHTARTAVTNNYNIYSAGATAINYFEGVLTVAGGTNFNKTSNDAVGYITTYTKSRGTSGADGDDIGTISFKSYNDAGTPELIEYASITGEILDASDTTEDGTIWFNAICDGTAYSKFLNIGSHWNRYPGNKQQAGIEFRLLSGLSTTAVLTFMNDYAGTSARVIASQWLSSTYHCNTIQNYAATSPCGWYWQTNGDTIAFAVGSGPNYLLYASFFTSSLYNIGTSGNKVIGIFGQAVAPTTCPADGVQLWVIDKDGVAGDARLYIMSEANTNKTIIGKGGIELYDVQNAATSTNTLQFTKSRATSGADGDDIGTISFKSYNDNPAGLELIEYAKILAEIADASDAAERGSITFTVRTSSDQTRDAIVIKQPADSGASGLVTINAVSFTNNNAMFINAAGAQSGVRSDAVMCFAANPSQAGTIGFSWDNRTATGGTALRMLTVCSGTNTYPMIEYMGYNNFSGDFIHFDVAYENFAVNFTGNFILWEKYTTEYFKIDQYVDFSIWRRTVDAVGHTTTYTKSRASSGADGDDIATLSFKSYNDAWPSPELIEYAKILVEIGDASDSTEDAQVTLTQMLNGTATTGNIQMAITKTDTGDPAAGISYEGLMCINTFDNNVKIYADGAWRSLATW